MKTTDDFSDSPFFESLSDRILGSNGSKEGIHHNSMSALFAFFWNQNRVQIRHKDRWWLFSGQRIQRAFLSMKFKLSIAQTCQIELLPSCVMAKHLKRENHVFMIMIFRNVVRSVDYPEFWFDFLESFIWFQTTCSPPFSIRKWWHMLFVSRRSFILKTKICENYLCFLAFCKKKIKCNELLCFETMMWGNAYSKVLCKTPTTFAKWPLR